MDNEEKPSFSCKDMMESLCSRGYFLGVNAVLLGICAAFVLFGVLLEVHEPLLDKFFSQSVDAKSSTALPITHERIEQTVHYFQGVLKPLAIWIIVFGALMTAICVLGFATATCDHCVLLVIYVIFLILALLTHLSLVATFVVTENQVYDGITLRMKEEFASYESHNVNNSGSIVSGFLMAALHCCGFRSGEEYMNSTLFIRNSRYHGYHLKSLKAPIECCKVIEPEVETGCPNKFTRTNSYFFDGCESNLKQYLHGHIPVIVYASLCVVPLDLILIAISLRTWFRARQVGKYESFSQESEQYAPNSTVLKEAQPVMEPEYDEI